PVDRGRHRLRAGIAGAVRYYPGRFYRPERARPRALLSGILCRLRRTPHRRRAPGGAEWVAALSAGPPRDGAPPPGDRLPSRRHLPHTCARLPPRLVELLVRTQATRPNPASRPLEPP